MKLIQDKDNSIATDEKLAIEGGKPVRTEPLPLEFPGVHHMDEEEVEAAVRVLKSRSLFRYYGVDLTNWGLHVYFNIPSLVNKTSVDKKGWPWKLSENRSSNSNYHKGSCPVADRLFERSILLAIPSCLTERDEGDIVHAFRKVLGRPA